MAAAVLRHLCLTDQNNHRLDHLRLDKSALYTRLPGVVYSLMSTCTGLYFV